MWSSFRTRVPGKWVLTGEHAVLRGAAAVALPHPELGLELAFQPQVWEGLSVVPRDAEPVIGELVDSIRDALEAEGRSFPAPVGTLEIASTIPVGAGLGSSAALCVAIARWMAEPLGLAPGELLEFATRLEHRFHGRSSGMDVSVIEAGEAISFVMGQPGRPLGTRKVPRFTFHDTGLRTRTSECVLKVEAFREEEPARAMRVDEEMGAASREAMEGLFRYDSGDARGGLELVARAMLRAQECFMAWQLVPGAALRLQQSLLAQGALAAKITGAGGGGMVVALWE